MKACVINNSESIALVEKPVPKIRPDYVLIKVMQTGICGSDIERFHEGSVKHKNVTMGHEIVGTVIEKGSDCGDINVGQKVVVIPLIPCRTCEYCQRGLFSLCEKYTFIGSSVDGGVAEFISVPITNIMTIPDTVSDDEAVLLEPLAVAMHAVLRAEYVFGSQVIIIGCGAIGLLAVGLCKIAGARSIAVVDVVDERLHLAQELGADILINQKSVKSDARYRNLINQNLRSIVIESTGSTAGKLTSISISNPRGQVILVGGLNNDLSIPKALFSQILRKELTVKGCWMNYSSPFPGEEWTHSLHLIEKKAMDIRALIGGKFSIDMIQEAFKKILSNNITRPKIIIKTGE